MEEVASASLGWMMKKQNKQMHVSRSGHKLRITCLVCVPLLFDLTVCLVSFSQPKVIQINSRK